MTPWQAIAPVLAGLAAGVAARPRLHDAVARLAQVRPAPIPALTAAATTGRALPRSALACAVAGVAAALLLARPLGVVVGLAVALAGPTALGRLEPSAQRAARAALVSDLPLALDLLAACLCGGAALPAAARAVADGMPGPCGDRLAAVATALAVGSPASEAWVALAAGDPSDPLGPASRALARAAETGAPVAAVMSRLAEQARADARSRGEQAARRAGVLAVAPLGLCFLPAFVLIGVVPVVAGLVGPLLAGLA